MPVNLKKAEQVWYEYCKKYCYSKNKEINILAADEALIGFMEMIKATKLLEEWKNIKFK